MNITIDYLILENFQGAKHTRIDPNGQSLRISGQNGAGKTRQANALLWLLVNKDLKGATQFGNRTVNQNPESSGYLKPIKGLVCAVEAGLRFDGDLHVLRREEHELITRQEVTGYTSKYTIDEIPTPEGKYRTFLTKQIATLEVLRMLLDLHYVCGSMPWDKVRDVLKEVGDVKEEPEGVEELLEAMKGRNFEDYRKVIRTRKKAFEKERDAVPSRIQENQRTLTGYAEQVSDSEPELQAKRELKTETIAAIEAERQNLRAGEKKRAEKCETLSTLKAERSTRESELANDTSAVAGLLEDKADMQVAYSEQEQALAGIQGDLKVGRAKLHLGENGLAQLRLAIQSVRKEHAEADSPNCSHCGQVWPVGKAKPELEAIVDRGKKLQAAVNESRADIDTQRVDINLLLVACEKAEQELREKEAANKAKLIEIHVQMKDCPRPKPGEDDEWNHIQCKIEYLQEDIGPPVTEQLETIEHMLVTANDELKTLDDTLRNFDNIEQVKARLADLGTQEKKLSQRIADCNCELSRIDSYIMALGDMITEAIQDKFKHIRWVLYREHHNGGLDPCCTAELNGVLYPGMSGGERIRAGIDVVNVLSDHYNVRLPLFVDEVGEFTSDLEANTQTIALEAKWGMAEIQVEEVAA